MVRKIIILLLLIKLSTGQRDCSCVPYYLCMEDGHINKNGENLLDYRSKREVACTSPLEVCCKVPPIAVDIKNLTCGRRSSLEFHIITSNNFNNALLRADFPWTVGILKSGKFLCGGSLIHPQVAMTAAHCVTNKKDLIVRAGSWDTKTNEEDVRYQDVNVVATRIHPKYLDVALLYDIALLILHTPVLITAKDDTVGIACLPAPNKVVQDGICYASGWERERTEEDKDKIIPKQLELPIVPHLSCQNRLRSTRLGQRFHLHKTFLCAGGEYGKDDTCTGDGGSPLVCPVSNKQDKYVQVGIVSWGIGCSDEVPGVYTNIAHQREWIDEVMNQERFAIRYDLND